MSDRLKRFSIGQRPDGRALVTDLDSGDILAWVDAAEVDTAPGNKQILWLGVIVDGVVTTQAQPQPTPATPA